MSAPPFPRFDDDMLIVTFSSGDCASYEYLEGATGDCSSSVRHRLAAVPNDEFSAAVAHAVRCMERMRAGR